MPGNSMTLVFRTDGSVAYDGFHAVYRESFGTDVLQRSITFILNCNHFFRRRGIRLWRSHRQRDDRCHQTCGPRQRRHV